MDYAFVSVPAAPVRRKPSHRREMVNQLLFGEKVKVLKRDGPLWVKISSLHDNYEGWMTKNMLAVSDEAAVTTHSAYATTSLSSEIIWNDGMVNKMHIPFASSLPEFDGVTGKIRGLEFNIAGTFRKRNDPTPHTELLNELVIPWLNAPYLWGGRTPFGIDCSGFVQVIYKLMGIDLPRDAWQQAQEGKTVKKIRESRAGDLAFFDNKEDIVHTGILLGNDEIIHASGKVKIDKISKKGVFDAATGKKLLSLQLIRRIW